MQVGDLVELSAAGNKAKQNNACYDQYGIIMEISYKNTDYLAVASLQDGSWHVVDIEQDEILILSEGAGG